MKKWYVIALMGVAFGMSHNAFAEVVNLTNSASGATRHRLGEGKIDRGLHRARRQARPGFVQARRRAEEPQPRRAQAVSYRCTDEMRSSGGLIAALAGPTAWPKRDPARASLRRGLLLVAGMSAKANPKWRLACAAPADPTN
jgi:hypothetical protein